MGAILVEFRASEPCEGPLQQGRLESTHLVEKTVDGQEYKLWLFRDIDTAMSTVYYQLFNCYNTNNNYY